tara:strand:- start:207 stop:449 length:243 start_codon:yes stop_codon:yes gene_type:complete
MERFEDESKRIGFKVDFNINDVRLLYYAMDFYLKNRGPSGGRPPNEQFKTKHLEHLKRIFHTMLMEYTLVNQTAEDINKE